MGSEITDQKGGMRDHRSEGWDLEAQPRDQPFLRDQGSGIRLYHLCGILDQHMSRFWNQGSEVWVQK